MTVVQRGTKINRKIITDITLQIFILLIRFHCVGSLYKIIQWLQCFCQTPPLLESCVAIRDGPHKKRANLALSFDEAAGLTHSGIKYFKSHPRA